MRWEEQGYGAFRFDYCDELELNFKKEEDESATGFEDIRVFERVTIRKQSGSRKNNHNFHMDNSKGAND